MLCLFISPTPTSTSNQSLIYKKKLSWLKWKMLYIFYHNKSVSSKKLLLNTQPINLYMILSFVFWLLVESHHNQL